MRETRPRDRWFPYVVIAVLLAMYTFGTAVGFGIPELSRKIGESLTPIAGVMLIVGAGGGFKQVLVDGGTGTALQAAGRNAQANGVSIDTTHDDAFDALKALQEQGERFDVVVVDPPAFIKRKKDVPQGQAAYRKLNQLALGLMEGDGLLVSCSCSYHLAAEDLVSAIQTAARHTGRFVQVLEAGGQSPDHPVHPAIPETRYLKAFFCRVTRE